MTTSHSYTSLKTNITHLRPKVWAYVNRELIRKALSEFSHELIITPQSIHKEEHLYNVTSDFSNITYEFRAKKRALDHWDIDVNSIIKRQDGDTVSLDALHFILEFKDTLGISDEMLPTYLEEITSTLSSAAYKYTHQEKTSKELIHSSFQEIEHAMTEGHPCFVANNGRIGFDALDYLQYAPETATSFQLIWVAAHQSKATFNGIKELSYEHLLAQELSAADLKKFNTVLDTLGLDPNTYLFMPVHPWQWEHKIVPVFAADIAQQDLVILGASSDQYSAQQSIRTLYNESHPQKMYTKTALSILNMGFMRGLSPYYMQSTPAITTWITELLENDNYLQKTGFTMLGEVATIGYRNTYYEGLGKTNAHNKMLATLWRESPWFKVKKGQQLMTMAAFLHIDYQQGSFLAETIKASSYEPSVWLQKYLNAYLTPLLHCLYAYELVFMPHGENIIMVMENHTPVHMLMKDITEEVIVFNDRLTLPDAAQRLFTKTTDDKKVLSIFTDVFDSFFRFMSSILETHLAYSETLFWEQVASCITTYQKEHPEYTPQFKRYNLFSETFDRCCLNRLQLQNTKQMLDLGDPIESLQLVGTLKNPLATYTPVTSSAFKPSKPLSL